MIDPTALGYRSGSTIQQHAFTKVAANNPEELRRYGLRSDLVGGILRLGAGFLGRGPGILSRGSRSGGGIAGIS
jgi:hypothetical protein